MIPGQQRFNAPSMRFSFIVFLALFGLTAFQTNAQQVFVEGPFCQDDCSFWFFETNATPEVFEWTIYYDASNPGSDPIYQTTSQEPSMTWCETFLLGPGTHVVFVVITDGNGNTLFEGDVFLEVWNGFVEYYVDAFGLYQSSCDSFMTETWYYSDFDSIPACWDVCVGANSAFFIEDLVITGSDGTTGGQIEQSYWTVFGVNATVSQTSNGVNIEWLEAGTASVNYLFIVVDFNGCVTEQSFSLCVEVAPAPEAAFSTDPPPDENGILEICEGQTVYFTNESVDAESFFWEFGDGGTSSAENPDYTYTEAGVFEISLATIAGDCGCVDTTRMTVIVEGNESPFVDCVATICEGETITYTANTGCNAYTWTISGNGTIIDGGGMMDDYVTIEWGAGPIGEITLDTDGCPDLSTCTEAAYLQVPIVSDDATIEGPERPCKGDQSVYSITAFEGTGFIWTVSSFGTIISGQGTPSVVVEWFDGFIPTDAQWVAVEYDNCYLGCGGSDQLTVNIRPEFYASGTIEVCENESADYSVTNTQTNMGFPANYTVEDASGSTVWTSSAAAANVTIDWNFGPGSYTVVVEAQTIDDYCVDQYEIDVLVYPQPVPVASVDGQTEICPGISYTYTVEDVNLGDRFRWAINNSGFTSEREGESIAVTWTGAGPYELSVSRISLPLSCISDATTVPVQAVSGFAISGDVDVCLDQIGAYTSDQMGDVYYAWSIVPASAGTITGDPTADSIAVLWHDPGMAQVILDICGQQEIFAVNVNAPPQPVVDHPAALCPGTTAPVSTLTPYVSYSWQDTIGNELSAAAMPDLGPGYYRVEVTDALGCTGFETFSIYGYPESQISISTPDYNIFCTQPPFTRLYAVNTEDGYTYQWYMDGLPIPGETSTQYTATALGNYWVEIIDENGCQFASNNINVYVDCNDTRCQGNSGTCSDHDFAVMDTGSCDIRDYSIQAPGAIPGSAFWNFDDPDSGAANTATGDNVTHDFTKPGFYRVLMGALYDDGMGGQFGCIIIKPDTVLMVADFDYDGVCPGLPVQFYDLSTFLDLTSIVGWSWDFGDPASGADNTATDKDPVHIFTGEGNYDVTLTVTSAAGCTATITKTVTIFPQPYTNIPDPTVTCAATALEFLADVEPTVSDVEWDFGDPGSGNANSSTLFTTYHAYDTPGNYDVSLTATSIYGCTNTAVKTVTITPNVLDGDIDPAGLSQICEGDDVTLTGPAGAAVEWAWSNGADTPSITVDAAGTYEVTVTSVEGCTYTPTAAVVDVIPAPQSPIRAVEYNDYNQPTGYTYDTLYLCFGENVFLETEQQAAYTYSWSNGDMGTSTEYSEDRGNLLPVGTHDITMTVTDNNTGCSQVEGFVVIVHPNPAMPTLDSGTGPLCAGTTTTISIQNVEANTTYVWSNGELGTSVTTDEAGEFYTVAINEFGCRTESEVTEIFAGPDISLVPNGCHTRCSPDTLCLPTIPGVISYQWYQDGVAVPAPDGTIPELVIEQSGSYTLEMEDINGCVQTSEPLNIELLPGFGNLSGIVLYDLNEDMLFDPADSLAGDIVFLLSNSTGVIATDTTSETGTYSFLNVPEGMYTICIDTTYLPEGWWPYEICRDVDIIGCDFMGEGSQMVWLLGPDCVEEESFLAVEICEDDTYPYDGDDYPVGEYQFTFNTVDGCDSIFNLSVLGLPVSTTLETLYGCPGSEVDYNGQLLAVGSSMDFTLMATNGCDSTVTVMVEPLVTTTGTETLYGCPGSEVDYNGQLLAVGSSMDITLVGSNGCDSTVTVLVEALATTTGAETLLACPGTTATYNGQTLDIGDVQDFTLAGSNGCDSIVTVIVQEATVSSTQLVESICPGESFVYLGQDYPGGTDEVFTFTNSLGCDSMVQLIVEESPDAEIDWVATESCASAGTGTLAIIPQAGNQPFVYGLGGNPLQTNTDFGNLQPGSYELMVEDALGCQFTTPVAVQALPNLIVDVADAILPCDSAQITLQPQVLSGDDGQLQYTWSDGITSLQRTVTDPGDYTLTVSNGCEVVDLAVSIEPEISAQASLIYVPNAFSPNSDGINDEFRLFPATEVQVDKIDFQVFDRWGSMLFDAADGLDAWDGFSQGRRAVSGVYVWHLEATVNLCGREIEISQEGELVLVR